MPPVWDKTMPRQNALTWPILELLDEELNETLEEPGAELEPEPIPTDALFMAECDVFLTRDGSDAFTLTLRRRGLVSEIRLTAGVDESGTPALVALVA
jgi:hypothetical protein